MKTSILLLIGLVLALATGASAQEKKPAKTWPFHDSDGRIEWYDVVNDERRPYADFLKDRNSN